MRAQSLIKSVREIVLLIGRFLSVRKFANIFGFKLHLIIPSKYARLWLYKSLLQFTKASSILCKTIVMDVQVQGQIVRDIIDDAVSLEGNMVWSN